VKSINSAPESFKQKTKMTAAVGTLIKDGGSSSTVYQEKHNIPQINVNHFKTIHNSLGG
jgi:uncharacterized membrane protein